jgi:PST family polysaccharide transporter
MAATTGVGKASAVAGQVALGWLLFNEDWGLYALTLSIAAFGQIVRGGGLGNIIIQRGAPAYDAISGPAFWMALAFNAAAALVLVVAGRFASHLYGHPELAPMLSVAALSYVVGAPAVILTAKLRADLAFKTLALIIALSSIARWACAIALAATGAGAMSFVWAMVAASAVDSAAAWWATRDSPWMRPPAFALWPGLYKSSVWLLISDFFQALAQKGDYLVLGMLVSLSIVGYYTFGYQLTAQIGVLLSMNVRSVLFPVLTRLVDEPRRFANAADKTLGVLVLTGSAVSFLLLAVADPLEMVIWGGKWQDAVPVMQVFAAVVPIRLMMTVPASTLLAKGRFGLTALMMFVQAVCLVTAAFVGGTLFESNAGMIAAVVGVTQSLFHFTSCLLVLRSAGCQVRKIAWSSLKPWLVASAVGIGAVMVDGAFLIDLHPIVRCGLIAGGYATVYLALARLLLSRHLESLSSLLPRRIDRMYRGALFLPKGGLVG